MNEWVSERMSNACCELVLLGETRVLGEGIAHQLKYQTAPPVSGALGVIGVSGRAS